MKGTDVRYGWIVAVIGLVLIIGFISCDENQTFQPPDPVEKYFHGRVTDDQGEPLPNVTVTIYEENASPGGSNYSASIVTDNEGEWNETLFTTVSQTYSIYYSRSGMFDVIQSRFVSLGIVDTIDAGTIAIPSHDIDDVYRIVLTWGNQPPDLDAHLTGPKGDGSRFHVYWGNRLAESVENEPLAQLISDRRNGFGPETIGIKTLIPGTYRFSVHNYSRDGVADDETLVALSNAVVRVFTPGGLEREFSIADEDAPVDSVGNTWNVFEIDGETGEIEFINEMRDGVEFDEDEYFKLDEKPEYLTIP